MNTPFRFLAAAILVGSLASCSPPPLSRSEAPSPQAGARLEAADKKMAATDQLMAAPVPEGAASGAYVATKQVKTGSVSLEVSAPAAAEAALTAKLLGAGGYVETTVATESSRSLTLRIPAAAFDSFLDGLKAWGRIIHRQVTVADVSLQYYDLETRLKNQKLLLDQYRSFLTQTKKMDEILDVMGRISGLTTEIESTQGQFRYLSRQIDYSTLSVEITAPLLSGGRAWPDWSEGWSDLAHTLAEFGTGTVFFLLAALVIGPVVLGAAALLFWLFAGKPGLWRRLKALKFRPETKPQE